MAADIYAGLGELHDIYKSVDGKMSPELLEELVEKTETLRNEIVS